MGGQPTRLEEYVIRNIRLVQAKLLLNKNLMKKLPSDVLYGITYCPVCGDELKDKDDYRQECPNCGFTRVIYADEGRLTYSKIIEIRMQSCCIII